MYEKIVGERLLRLRKKWRLTQKEFAQKVKADYTYIGKIGRGEQYPSLKMLERIGRAFSIPLGYFFMSEEELKKFECSEKDKERGEKFRRLSPRGKKIVELIFEHEREK